MPEIRDFRDLDDRLQRISRRLPELLAPIMARSVSRLRSEILENLSGRVLQRQSGDLYNSVSVRARENQEGIELTVEAGGSRVPYAAIHEYGGQTGRNNATTIPARPYVLPAIEHELQRMTAELGDGITEMLIYGRAR